MADLPCDQPVPCDAPQDSETESMRKSFVGLKKLSPDKTELPCDSLAPEGNAEGCRKASPSESGFQGYRQGRAQPGADITAPVTSIIESSPGSGPSTSESLYPDGFSSPRRFNLRLSQSMGRGLSGGGSSASGPGGTTVKTALRRSGSSVRRSVSFKEDSAAVTYKGGATFDELRKRHETTETEFPQSRGSVKDVGQGKEGLSTVLPCASIPWDGLTPQLEEGLPPALPSMEPSIITADRQEGASPVRIPRQSAALRSAERLRIIQESELQASVDQSGALSQPRMGINLDLEL
jgi:hypothetical protein